MYASTVFNKLINEAKQRIEETDIHDVKQRYDKRQPFHIIDVREPHEYQTGHLPSAINIPRGVIELKIETEIPSTDAPIVLYCGSGMRSALACDSLQNLGYINVQSMAGGFNDWQQAGYPVESEYEGVNNDS